MNGIKNSENNKPTKNVHSKITYTQAKTTTKLINQNHKKSYRNRILSYFIRYFINKVLGMSSLKIL